jgi:hypothetical protein
VKVLLGKYEYIILKNKHYVSLTGL